MLAPRDRASFQDEHRMRQAYSYSAYNRMCAAAFLKPVASTWDLAGLTLRCNGVARRCDCGDPAFRIDPTHLPGIVCSSMKTAGKSTNWQECTIKSEERQKLPSEEDCPMKTMGKSTNIVWQECMAKKEDKQKHLGQKGCIIWITGLSGSGKSTLACTLDYLLLKRGNLSYILDGDNVRHGLNKNLGFSAEDRAENIRRVGEVAKLFVDAGVICIVSLISPYRKDRAACRELLQKGEFIEVYMNFPLALCEERDPKGLYKLARAGKIKGFTGIDDPYEAPFDCEVVMELIEGRCPTAVEMATHLIRYLEKKGFLDLPH